jgi:uncharacterized protein
VNAKTGLGCAIDELSLVDSHEHLISEQQWVEFDVLQDLFGNAYINADLFVAGAARDAMERLFDRSSGDVGSRFADVANAWELAKHTGYGEAVQLVAREVYGLDDLTAQTIEQAQAALGRLQQPGGHYRLLKERAGLDHVQINGVRFESEHPDFFLFDLSWFEFCSGMINRETLHELSGVEVAGLESLAEAMEMIFARFGPSSIAVKSQHAYVRTLRWEERSEDDAARALELVLEDEDVDTATRLCLGDWCWARGVEMATRHNLPFKIHTGYHAGSAVSPIGVTGMPLEWINAGNLCALLTRYPDARFVLMHAAYPYSDELVAPAKHYPNVSVDLCWAWAIDPHSAADFVRRFLHAVPINKLFAFGGDTGSPTNTVAFALQARKWLTRALETEIEAGDLTETGAVRIADRLMRENQYACFDVEGTRTAASQLAESATTLRTPTAT